MIDITKVSLPSAVEVGGRPYKIKSDFKNMLIFQRLLKDKTSDIEAFDFIYSYEKPADRVAGILAVCKFMNPPQELPHAAKDGTKAENVLDYDIDADLIYSAFMDCYGIDLINTSMHWYKFCTLLHAVHDCKLSDVIGYRLWQSDGRNDEYSRRMQKLQDAWRLPQPEDTEPDEALDEFLSQLKG